MKMFACDCFCVCIFVFENESVACHYYYFRILQCVYLDWECTV